MDEKVCKKACEVLRKTNDGNKLTRKELFIVQMAVNHSDRPEWVNALNELHKAIVGA